MEPTANDAGEPKPALWMKVRRGLRLKRVRWSLYAGIVISFCFGSWACMIRMPGTSWSGPLPPLSEEERAVAESLKRDVEALAGRIGNRNTHAYPKLMEAVDHIETRMKEAGLTPARQSFDLKVGVCHNIEAEIRGARHPEEIVIVGAHYDSVFGGPGANDNATGVAAMLTLAAAFSRPAPDRTLRFVAFVNEETPYFMTDQMGSRVYARRCRERGEKITAMLSLETMGCFSDRDGTQDYPFPVGLFYPSRGNFIAFVGNLGSRSLVRGSIATFRRHAQFPSEGAALPGGMPGVGWSDHSSFWNEGYPGIMVTDTAPFRYAHYHTANDTPDKVDFERCARVVVGLVPVVAELVRAGDR